MNDSLQKILVGGAGIAGTEVDVAQSLDPTTITDAGALIIQILIGIVTLFGLFKRKKA